MRGRWLYLATLAVATWFVAAGCADPKPSEAPDPCPEGFSLVDDMCRDDDPNNNITNNDITNNDDANNTNNGQSNNGMTNNGMSNNGMTNNGQSNNGMTNNGSNNGSNNGTNNGSNNGTNNGTNGTNNGTNNAEETAVVIDSFGADPAAGGLGVDVTLSWETTRAVALSLTATVGSDDPELVDTSGQPLEAGSRVVSPRVTTRYVLTAMGDDESIDQSTLTVAVPLEILEASAAPSPVAPGSSVTVSYRIQGARSASLYDGSSDHDLTIDGDGRGELLLVNIQDSVTVVITALGVGDEVDTINIPITVEGQQGPAQILTFGAAPQAVALGGSFELSWTMQDAVSALVEERDANDALVVSTPVDVADLDAGSMSFDDVQEPRRFVLVATGANTEEVSAGAEVRVALTSANVRLSEVFYDAPGDDAGLEWIELYNPGSEAINLSWLTLGHGSNSFADNTQRLPDFELAPGGCAVIGGPTSSADNGAPDFDATFAFEAGLPEPSGGTAAGVALFADGTSIDAEATPIAATVYGNGVGGEQNFIGANGQPIVMTYAPGATAGRSLYRVVDVPSQSWGVMQRPSPGVCTGLWPLDTTGQDSQLFEGRRSGTELGGGTLGLRVFNASSADLTVLLGDVTLACADAVGGVSCTIPPGTGRHDLTLRHGDGDVVYAGFYAYENIDFCNIQFPEAVDETAGSSLTFYGRVYEEGLTEPDGDNGVVAEFGYGPAGTEPMLHDQFWTFFPATFNVSSGNDDEYQREIALPAQGTWSFVYRMRRPDSDIWTLCDVGGTVNNNAELANYFDLENMGVMVTR